MSVATHTTFCFNKIRQSRWQIIKSKVILCRKMFQLATTNACIALWTETLCLLEYIWFRIPRKIEPSLINRCSLCSLTVCFTQLLHTQFRDHVIFSGPLKFRNIIALVGIDLSWLGWLKELRGFKRIAEAQICVRAVKLRLCRRFSAITTFKHWN